MTLTARRDGARHRGREGDGGRYARREPRRALVRVGRGHRDGAPDRFLEQHEGLDRRRDERGTDLRGAEPGPAPLRRLLQQAADGRAPAHDRAARDDGRARRRPTSPRAPTSTTRSSPLSPRFATRRSAQPASCCSPTGTTWGAPRASMPPSGSSRPRRSASSRSGSSRATSRRPTSSGSPTRRAARYAAASSSEDLSAVYNDLGFQLGNEYLLRYRSAAPPETRRRRPGDDRRCRGAGLLLLRQPGDGHRWAVRAELAATRSTSRGS